VFEVVTQFHDRFVLNVATHALYDRASSNPLVPYLVISAKEMQFASRIIVDCDSPGARERMGMDF
jgi:hypothetical protein